MCAGSSPAGGPRGCRRRTGRRRWHCRSRCRGTRWRGSPARSATAPFERERAAVLEHDHDQACRPPRRPRRAAAAARERRSRCATALRPTCSRLRRWRARRRRPGAPRRRPASMPPASGSSTPEPRRRSADSCRRARLGRRSRDRPPSRRRHRRTHGPTRSCWPLANGPISAIVLPDRGQRQQVAVVLEQDDRLAPGLARQRAGLRKHRARALALLVDAAEGVVEQAEHRLHREHPADGLVELRFGHSPLRTRSGRCWR